MLMWLKRRGNDFVFHIHVLLLLPFWLRRALLSLQLKLEGERSTVLSTKTRSCNLSVICFFLICKKLLVKLTTISKTSPQKPPEIPINTCFFPFPLVKAWQKLFAEYFWYKSRIQYKWGTQFIHITELQCRNLQFCVWGLVLF